MDYQKIILLGNTTADVEVKQAESGTQYARFSVGVSKGKDETIFFPVTVFGKSAETAGEILAKGDRVLVEGRLDVDQESGRFSVIARTFCKA
jgi:single-strand DNA-binding protein